MKTAAFNAKKLWGAMNITVKSLLSLVIALIIGGIILAVAGYNPLAAYGAILKGSLGSSGSLINTLIQATPLIFTGLAFAVSSKTGLINLGMEGQMVTGAMVAAIVGAADLGLPMAIHLPVTILVGVVAGGLFGLLAGFFKARFGANEFIVTIMLNYIAASIVDWLASGPLKAEGGLNPETEKVLETALLPRIIPNRGLTIALFIGVILSVAVHYYLNRSKSGYELRAVGKNRLAAETAGINIGRMTMLSMFLSGAIAGMAGVSMVLGINERFVLHFSPGYGFTGIAIASLAGMNPIAIIPAALIFGALRAGALVLNMTQKIQPEFADLIQALVVLFVAMPLLFQFLTKQHKRKEKKQ